MSLTSLLKKQDVKEQFRKEFKKPKFTTKKELLAPPLSKRYGLVGTAFDYLMRFYLKQNNSDAIARRWVAESAVAIVTKAAIRDAGLTVEFHSNTLGETEISAFDDAVGVVPVPETDLTRKVCRILEQTKEVYSNYLSSGKMTDEVIKSTLLLAQLDVICRTGRIDNSIGVVDKDDVVDLRNLISMVDLEILVVLHFK